MRTILLIIFSYLAIYTYAQDNEITVSGYVYSLEKTESISPLPFCSVAILQLSDSSYITGSTTNIKGYFNIKYKNNKKISKLLKVSYTGMSTEYYPLKQIKNELIDSIILKDKFILLKEVSIIANQPKIQQKRDTTIINAEAFTTPSNAYLQELIKKIPGIIYDDENKTLLYNGKVIKEINVNGEAFFNKDTQIALKNLPAKFIKTIKIYNKKENFPLKLHTNENYILDLQTKEEYNGSFLNSIKVGYGTHKKNDLEQQTNYFKKNGDNLSLILHSTNKDLNSYYNDNISQSVGLNIFHKFNDKLNIASNIQYKKNKIGEQTKSYTENYLQEKNIYSLGITDGISKNYTIDSFLGVEWKPDKKTSLLFNFGYNYNNSDGINKSTNVALNHSIDFIKTDINSISKEYKVNSNIYKNSTANNDNNSTWQFLIYRDINERIRLDFNLLYNQNKGKNINLSNATINYYQLSNSINKDSVFKSQQYIYSPIQNAVWNTSLTLSQTIGKKLILSYIYNLNIIKETSQRNTYDLSGMNNSDMNKGTIQQNYKDKYIDSLSNNSYSKSYIHNMGLRLNYNSKQWNINASFGYAPLKRLINQHTGTIRTDTIINSIDFQSSISANWHKNNMDIYIYYNGQTNQPPLSLLLPVTNISNPLNKTKGNPYLKKTFMHSVNMDFRGFKGIYVSTRYQTNTNDIAHKITYNSITGASESIPVNINGNWNINTNVSWNKTLGNFSIYINENALYREQLSLISESFNIEPTSSKTYDFNLLSKMQLAYQFKWGNIDLSGEHYFKKYTNTLQESRIYSSDYKIKLNGIINLPRNIQIANDFSYTFRNGTIVEKNNNKEILWNLTITWLFLKEKSAELTFYWSDILKQRKNYTQNATANSYYEFQTKQVPGFILFSFRYNFNLKFKK